MTRYFRIQIQVLRPGTICVSLDACISRAIHKLETDQDCLEIEIDISQEKKHAKLQIVSVDAALIIGSIQFDRAWKINPVFQTSYPDLLNTILDKNFDLSALSESELNLVAQHGIFCPTGIREFGGWNELRINAKVDSILDTQSSDWSLPQQKPFSVDQNQCFECDLTVPPAS